MRTPFNALITEKALRVIASRRNSDLIDMIANDPEHQFQLHGSIKNVCAKVSISLANDIDEVCSLLDISKRSFLEVAMIDAVAKAHVIISREGVWEALEEVATTTPPVHDEEAA